VPSEKHDVAAVCGVIYECHFRRAKYYVSIPVTGFKNSIRLIRKM
jgi:hypothetical protein